MASYRGKVGGGWSFFFIVLTFGIVLAFFGVTVGGGGTIRIPLTEANLSIGGSLGKKEVTREVLPSYLRNRVADNNTFINQSTTVTIWVAEGVGVIVLGDQEDAPVADLKLNFRK